MSAESSGPRYVMAFFAAVAVASLCFIVLVNYHKGLAGFDLTGGRSYREMAWGFFKMNLFFLLLCSIFTSIITAIPYGLSVLIAKHFSIRTPVYFIAGGLITGFILTVVPSSVPNFGFNEPGTVEDIMNQRMAIYCPICVLSGLFAGITAAIIVRRTDKAKPVDHTHLPNQLVKQLDEDPWNQ